jgi:hypothetical protein
MTSNVAVESLEPFHNIQNIQEIILREFKI